MAISPSYLYPYSYRGNKLVAYHLKTCKGLTSTNSQSISIAPAANGRILAIISFTFLLNASSFAIS